MEYLSLKCILEVFDVPLNEEQAWAVCFQCARFLQQRDEQVSPFDGVDSVLLCKDGTVQRNGDYKSSGAVNTENELVESLGLVIYQALDYGLDEAEEHALSPALEALIERMTGSAEDAGKQTPGDEDDGGDDEGIEHDVDDGEDVTQSYMTLDDVIKVSSSHLMDPFEAVNHYRAVCRALVAEAIELRSFLDKISAEKQRLSIKNEDTVDGLEEQARFDTLKRCDWARLWIQMMRELRQGVKLRKVETNIQVQHSMEFELTPYEILMEDIRTRRYTLNKVQPADARIPPINKQHAHDIMLNFIRSRPPLHPVKDRVLANLPPRTEDPRETLLKSIRSEQKLRPTPGRIVETSRTKLQENDDTPLTSRKIIKPDFNLMLDDEDDDLISSSSSEEEDVFDEKNRVSPSPLSPLSPLSPRTPPKHASWKQQVVHDLVTMVKAVPPHRRHTITVCETPPRLTRKDKLFLEKPLLAMKPDAATLDDDEKNYKPSSGQVKGGSERRHSITVCQSPTSPSTSQGGHSHGGKLSPHTLLERHAPNFNIPPRNLQSALECLSLTIEEVMHIRNVLTKAELECLLVDPELHSLISKGKICFTCKKAKFSIFGNWSTKCKFCQRYVCNKCVSKMQIPTEHFEHIPVYTLSPSPMTPNSQSDIFIFDATGSVPTSPSGLRSFSPPARGRSSLSPQPTSSAHGSPRESSNPDHGSPRQSSNPDLARSISTPHGSATSSAPSDRSSPESSSGPFGRLKELARQGAAMAMNGMTDDAEAPPVDSPQPVGGSPSRRPPLERAKTISRATATLQGPMMNICKDCKAMVCGVIRASRASLATASPIQDNKAYSDSPVSRKPARNFHLDLKPVYKYPKKTSKK